MMFALIGGIFGALTTITIKSLGSKFDVILINTY